MSELLSPTEFVIWGLKETKKQEINEQTIITISVLGVGLVIAEYLRYYKDGMGLKSPSGELSLVCTICKQYSKEGCELCEFLNP